MRFPSGKDSRAPSQAGDEAVYWAFISYSHGDVKPGWFVRGAGVNGFSGGWNSTGSRWPSSAGRPGSDRCRDGSDRCAATGTSSRQGPASTTRSVRSSKRRTAWSLSARAAQPDRLSSWTRW